MRPPIARTAVLLTLTLLGSSGVSAAVINFGYLPGPDGIPGTPDDVPYTSSDITNFGGGRLIDDEYASAGVHFSGANVPSLGIIGGGFDSDDVFGPGTNTLLNGVRVGGDPVAPIGGVAAFSVLFDLPQTSVTVDVFAYLNSSGTSVPLTFRSGGSIVATQTLTHPTQVSGRFTLAPGVAFDQIDFGLTGPSNGGIGIDNLSYQSSLELVIDFGHLPGPDGIPGTPDDVPYTSSDITNFGGGRLIDDEYASAGVHFSGANVPSLGIIGGGFDSDDVFGPGTNTLLNGVRVGGDPVAPIGGVAAFSALFDLPQSSVTVDVFAYLNSSGTSVPLTFRSGGSIVATQTLTHPTQVADRFTLAPGVAFDQIDFGLTGPSSGGIGIDNLRYLPEPGLFPALGSGLALLGVLGRRRSAAQRVARAPAPGRSG